MSQKSDFEWFVKYNKWLNEQYGDCYLAIKDQKVIGVYNFFIEAIREAEKKEKFGTFIVQYCDGTEDCYTRYIN